MSKATALVVKATAKIAEATPLTIKATAYMSKAMVFAVKVPPNLPKGRLFISPFGGLRGLATIRMRKAMVVASKATALAVKVIALFRISTVFI